MTGDLLGQLVLVTPVSPFGTYRPPPSSVTGHGRRVRLRGALNKILEHVLSGFTICFVWLWTKISFILCT